MCDVPTPVPTPVQEFATEQAILMKASALETVDSLLDARQPPLPTDRVTQQGEHTQVSHMAGGAEDYCGGDTT